MFYVTLFLKNEQCLIHITENILSDPDVQIREGSFYLTQSTGLPVVFGWIYAAFFNPCG